MACLSEYFLSSLKEFINSCRSISSTILTLKGALVMSTSLMKEAYSMLYEMENHLRLIVKTNMEKKCGYRWVSILHENRNEKTSYFHDLVAFFGRYPQILTHFKTEQLILLRQAVPIRNKIAHSHLITETEYMLLEKCYKFVIKQPILKRNKLVKHCRVSSQL